MTESRISSGRLICVWLLGVVLLLCSLFVPESTASTGRAPGSAEAVPTPAFVPACPLKKGLVNPPERHRFEPKSLLKEHGLEGANLFSVNSIPASSDTVTRRVLAILVDFPDQSFVHQKLFVERHLLFLTQYYSIVSGGRLKLEPVHSDSVFTMPSPMTEYGNDDDLGARLVQLARDAVAAADSLIDFTSYDDVVIIHAGLGQEADVLGDSPELIWSASLGPAEFEYYIPDSLGNVGIATNDTLPDGRHKYIEHIAVLPEDESQDGYLFSPLGVYAHEYGHCLGLPDLYDTDSHDGTDSQGIGNWGLMGTGLWNANGYSPAEPCAWSKAVLGWKSVRVVTHCDTCALSYSEGANEAGDLVLVPIGGREYFLMENRLQDPNANGTFDFDDVNHNMVFDVYEDSYAGAEFDYFLPGLGTGSGLLIWHIDEQQIEAGMPYNIVNADALHKGVSLEEADGVEDLSQPFYDSDSYGSAFDSFREGNNASFTPYSLPNSDGNYGGKSLVFIENIGAPGQSMSFSVDIGKRQDNWPVSTLATFGANHPNAADLDGDGTPEIVACDEGGDLYVLESDGTKYLGSGSGPFKTLGEKVLSSPVIGDIDGDGLNEIVVVAASGKVYAWNGDDGSEVRDGDDSPATDGVLAQLPPVGQTDPVLSRWNDEGRDAIIFGGSLADTTLGSSPADSLYPLHVVIVEPDSVKTFTWIFSSPTFRAPIVSDLNEDGTKEILVATGSGDGRGRLNLIDHTDAASSAPQLCNCELAGDSVEFAEIVGGDLDHDGTMDIAGADTGGRLHLMHVSVASGQWTELAGWPLNLVYRDSLDLVAKDTSRIASISLGEIDNDGHLEVLATFGSRAYAVNYNGTVLVGWPPLLPVRPLGEGKAHGPLCADVTGDHRADYVGALSDGRLACVQADATIPAGWPLTAGSSSGASPLLADVDGDGLVELVCVRDLGVETLTSGEGAATRSLQVSAIASPRTGTTGLGQANGVLSGEIDVWKLGVPQESTLAFWPSYRRDEAHSGLVPSSLSLPLARTQTVSRLLAMPNPARGTTVTLHYTLSEAVDRVRVEIYDLAGRRVYSASPSAFAASDNWHAVDIGGFPPGVYLCSVEATKRNGASERAFAKMAVLR